MTERMDSELNEIWAVFKAAIKEKYGYIDNVMKLWFDESVLTLLSDSEAQITTKTDFKKDILEKNYMKPIVNTFRDELGLDVHVTVRSLETERRREKEIERAANTDTMNPSFYEKVGGSGIINFVSVPAAYKDYTFENFVIGASNKIAAAAAMAVASQPASNYNPLFIYGPSGLGKTHLLYAITSELTKRFPEYKTVYVKGDDFTNQLVYAISTNRNLEFREKYRSCDVLLIDDIQFIAGREATQEEFFHTFNELYENGKQIVFTSDRPPRDIERLEDRLRTRFESGLTVDIDPPDLDLRMAILRKKAEMMNIELPDDVIEYVAENLVSNVRQLEGAIKQIYAQSRLTGAEITIDLAKACISDKVKGAEPKTVTCDKIISCVAQKYGVTPAELKGRRRTQNIIFPRHVAAYMIKKLTDSSFPAVGRIFGRDHTTIINSVEVVEKRLAEDSDFEKEIAELTKNIKTAR
ncbi:MAG: chromosomal replication initiator protein DnaA [Firmicutes bacterium]|nr:chromosomal replication initiator protein DnaA [Candidatus Colimorpha enterica]